MNTCTCRVRPSLVAIPGIGLQECHDNGIDNGHHYRGIEANPNSPKNENGFYCYIQEISENKLKSFRSIM